jgi:alanine-glyoxylate transaminase/serine-glyoxylate transaminase/serine-pyruvate transaminase
MSTPLVGHLDPNFLELMDRTQELLRYAFQTANRLTFPIPGTGSAAMEASVANMLEPGDKVLVCINGYFGLRIAEMARRYGGEVRTLEKPWGEIFTPNEVEAELRKFNPKLVAIVHAETSTGVLQPLEQIVDLVHQYGGMLIVDTVTSLGGIPLFVDDQDLDVCYSASQKCLSSPPGLGPITFGKRAEEYLATRKSRVTSWYLDVTMVRKYWGAERSYHHTAPISANYAFYEALRILSETGLEATWKRHSQNASYLWDGLAELGLKCFVPRDFRLSSLTTVKVPENVDEMEIRRRLYDEFNIEIAGGLGELKGKVWRIGLMGYSSRRENVVTLLGALKDLLHG